MKIRKNDTVLIISGKDKGKKGKVTKSFPQASKVVVEGVNLIKKHLKGKRSGEKGQIVSIAKPLAVAIVKLVCPKCAQPTRLGYKTTESGKVRICKKCKQEID